MEKLGKGIIAAVDQLALDISGFVDWDKIAIEVETKATRREVNDLLGYLSYTVTGVDGNEIVDGDSIELVRGVLSGPEAANEDIEYIESDNFVDLLARCLPEGVMEIEDLAVLIMKFARAVNSVFVFEDECLENRKRQLRFLYTGLANVEGGNVEDHLHNFSFWSGFHVEYPVGVVSRGSITASSMVKIEDFSRRREWFRGLLKGGVILVKNGFRFVTGRSDDFLRQSPDEGDGIVRRSYNFGQLNYEASNSGFHWQPELNQIEQVEEGRVLFKNGEREYLDVETVRDMFSLYNECYKTLIDLYCNNGYSPDEARRLNNLQTKLKIEDLLNDVNFLRQVDIKVLLSLRNLIKQIEMVERLKKVIGNLGRPIEVLPKPEIHGVPSDLFKKKI